MEIPLFFVAVRFEYHHSEDEYQIIAGPFISEALAVDAKIAHATMPVEDRLEDHHSIVVIETRPVFSAVYLPLGHHGY